MADTMQFDLVSPEKLLASGPATAVQIPGADGDMTVMANHAPTITTLRPGVLRVEGTDATTEYVVTGGFAEISATGVSVLAERAVAKGDMTAEDMKSMVAEARAAHDDVWFAVAPQLFLMRRPHEKRRTRRAELARLGAWLGE